MRSHFHFLAALSITITTVQLHAQTPVYQWAETVSNVAIINSTGCGGASVATDGSVYVGGGISGVPEGKVIVGNNVVDAPFLARYDASGNCLWVRSPGGAVTTVGSNAIYVAGSFRGTKNIGGTFFVADSVDAFLARYDASGNVVWARQMGGAGRDEGFSVAVDATGQVQVAGLFQGSATFGSTTLVATHDSTGFLATYDAAGTFIRATIIGGVDNLAFNSFFNVDLACDATGRTYVLGSFDGTAGIGGINLTSAGDNAIYLARFESNGICTWAQQMGGTTNYASSLAVGNSGSIFVVGDFTGAGTFGGIALSNSLLAYGAFIAYYDQNGTAQWAQEIAVTSGGSDLVYSIAVNSTVNAVVSGYVIAGGSINIGGFTFAEAGSYLAEYNTAGVCQWADRLCNPISIVALGAADDFYLSGGNFGSTLFGGVLFDIPSGIPEPALCDQNAVSDGYLAHYDAARTYDWVRLMGSTRMAFDQCNGIATDAGGNVYTTGSFNGSAIFCGDTIKEFLAGSSIFLSKRDGNGACIWTRSISNSGDNAASALAIDANGDLYIAGSFSDTAYLGAVQLVSGGGLDLFVAKYDANGNCLWAQRGGGTLDERANAIAVNANGELTVAGSYSGTITIGTTTFTSLGFRDMFVARYTSGGTFTWAKSMGGSSHDELYGLAEDAAGNAYITGSFITSATFGTNTITGTGVIDMFIAKVDASGNTSWAQAMTGAGYKAGYALVINNTGNLYATGYYAGSIDFGTVNFTGNTGTYMAFLACYTPTGTNLWAEEFQTSSQTDGRALAARPGGDIVLAGDLLGTAVFGSTTLTSTGAYGDVLLAAFDANGQALWARNMGAVSSSGGAAWAVAADANNVYAAGVFGTVFWSLLDNGGSITFEPGDPNTVLVAPNSYDVFVTKYASDESVSIAEVSTTATDLSISPNPVDRLFTMECDVPLLVGSAITVRDMTGRVVHVTLRQAQGDRGTMVVDASELSPGTYTITVQTVKGNATARFVKQ